ncbi:MAG: carboxypeptidase-like regulatory domain-containing protein [Fimbriimonadaceae bacterium]|nr:carboxypeptidase-like regulatory domain-containing protein [Fimbriimonadaceae bacterium]
MAGCGGGGTSALGQLAGVITDINGGVVRGARVWIGSKTTNSNSSGAYILDGIEEGEQTVRAEIVQDGIRYVGQNVATIYRSERSKSVNIVVVNESQRGSVRGHVYDRQGRGLVNARVFAFGNALSSAVAITDSSGYYSLDGLQAGLDYEIAGSARGYNSDTLYANLAANEQRTLNFTLDDGTNPGFGPPQNLEAVIWTSPFEMTRGATSREAVEAIKRLFDPRHPRAVHTRDSVGGSPIETDLYWDPVVSDSLLGYGIYRGTSAFGPVAAIDFLRDPLTYFFADSDDRLQEGIAYYYEITALGTLYPDVAGSESAPSNRYGVTPLGDLRLLSVGAGPRFQWQPANHATSYVVYLFDRYPGLDVDSIWNNESTRTTNNYADYTGPGLQSGRRYYYVVLGLANDDDSRTISEIGEFVAN